MTDTIAGMELFAETSFWTLAGLIFMMRILDVSLGTMRTITVVYGKVPLSVVLGFFEVLVWITAISQLILRINEHPVLIAAYAGGFAAGNAVGIALEKKLALGRCVVRMISRRGPALADALDSFGQVLASFRSELGDEKRTLVFATFSRRDLPKVLERAIGVDPELFWVVERFSETSQVAPLPYATGWRALFKMK